VLFIIAMLLLIPPSSLQQNFGDSPKLAACEVADAQVVNSFLGMPADVRIGLRRAFKGQFAEENGPFNASDFIDPHNPVPQRRFLRAYKRGNVWLVWYEHGGIGYHLHASGLTKRHDPSSVEMDSDARFIGSTAKDLCAATKAFFEGVRTSSDL
jgi:hypothetical protein